MSIEIPGIDVSYHNGSINWGQVAQSGKKFAMIRVGWCGYDGRIQANGGLDNLFHTNMAAANKAGVDVGVYVYSYARSAADAKVAAQETLDLIAPYRLTYPVAFDMEVDSSTAYQHNTPAQNTAITKGFLQEVERGKYYAMLYTFKNFALTYLNMADLAAYDFWLAHYTSQTDYTGPYGIWQYSSGGSVAGISGNVDLNTAYQDYPAIIAAAGLNNLDGEAPDPPASELEQLRRQLAEAQAKIIDLTGANAVLQAENTAVRNDIAALAEKWPPSSQG